MQAVMQAPCGLVSQLYYKRKLSVYKFTTYSLSDGKKNSRKVLRLEGKEYISESGKMRPSKMVMPTDCTKCCFECSRILEEKRKELFQSFYSLKVYERQKDFICGNVQEKSTKTVKKCTSSIKHNLKWME